MANNETKKFKFQVINIKLQTSKTGDEKLEAYENLIKRLKNRKVHSSVLYSYPAANGKNKYKIHR